VVDEEAAAARDTRSIAECLAIRLPAVVQKEVASYSMFDDAEGDNWQSEHDDWWHLDDQAPEPLAEVTHEATSLGGESVQAAINARLRRTTRLTFFDDESGEEDMQLEPDDFALVTGMVDRRGWPEFSKSAKFAGEWKGMVFKRGHLGVGYYRDGFKLDISLALHLPAVSDVAPVTLELNDLISKGRSKANVQDDVPDTCPRRKSTSTGRKSIGQGLELEWPSDDSLAASSKFHITQGHWAFETVNGSCWNTAAEYMTQTSADFLAIQEAKIPKDSIADTEQAARNKGWRTSVSPCIRTEAEGLSAGTALGCRTHIGVRKSFADGCSDAAVQA